MDNSAQVALQVARDCVSSCAGNFSAVFVTRNWTKEERRTHLLVDDVGAATTQRDWRYDPSRVDLRRPWAACRPTTALSSPEAAEREVIGRHSHFRRRERDETTHKLLLLVDVLVSSDCAEAGVALSS